MHEDARDLVPAKAHHDDAAYDLRSRIDMVLPVRRSTIVPTGLFLELPYGFEAQIRPRSGLALKRGLTVLNTPGTIDADYRGEIGVILINHIPHIVVVRILIIQVQVGLALSHTLAESLSLCLFNFVRHTIFYVYVWCKNIPIERVDLAIWS